MAEITLRGELLTTRGELPVVGTMAPDAELVKTDLRTMMISDYKGTNLVLNIFPSIDTSTCARSVRAFNEKASSLANTKVLCISRDLPFAQKRFCGAEGLSNVENLSDFKEGAFGKKYGLEIASGRLRGLHARAVVVIDESGKVIYTQLIRELTQEPDYNAAITSLNNQV